MEVNNNVIIYKQNSTTVRISEIMSGDLIFKKNTFTCNKFNEYFTSIASTFG